MQLRAMQIQEVNEQVNDHPTHNQCEIQEVFASRIQDPTRAQVCSTKDNAS